MSGANLLALSSQEIEELGVDETDTEKLLQKIQWARFGVNASDGFVDDVPNEFLCPITCDLMENPVRCSDGFVYEESAIKEWFLTRRNTSPMTNLELGDLELVPCQELSNRIISFRNTS